MKYYPVFLDVAGKNCLVVGGGSVGARKAEMLSRCQAQVKVVSQEFDAQFHDHPIKGVTLEKKQYDTKDLMGMRLVFAATNNAGLNQQIKADAENIGILCNLADDPSAGDFILPSVVERGDLLVAVSTSGKSPAMARKIRQELEDYFGPEYADVLELLGALRQKMLAAGHDPDRHKKIFSRLIGEGLLDLVREGDDPAVGRLLQEITGKDPNAWDLPGSRSNR